MNNKIGTIVPVNHLDLTAGDSYQMALSYLAENKEYVDHFRNESTNGSYVLLDNSAIETGGPEDFKTYLEKASSMRVSCIMLPDHFKDPEATFDAHVRALDILGRMKFDYRFDIMFIPQGRTIDEYMLSALKMMNLFRSAPYKMYWHRYVCGISYRYGPMVEGDRGTLVDLLEEYAVYFDFYNFKIHLLGCDSDPRVEISPLLKRFTVQGVDSAYAAVYAAHEYALTREALAWPRPSRIVDFAKGRYNESLLIQNIEVWRRACKGTMILNS